MTSQFLAAAASIALVGAGVAGTAGTRSFEALPGVSTAFADGADSGAGGKCRVDIIRAGAAGAADITRQTLQDGNCICTITTGPASSNGSAEEIVTNLLRDRTCDGAPAPGKVISEAASGGGGGWVLPVVLAVVGAGGLVVALGKDSNG